MAQRQRKPSKSGVVRPSRAPQTVWQRKRDDVLRAGGFTKKDVWLTARGVSEQTVRAVIAGDFRNESVIEAFCKLTSTDAAQMFPLDEPRRGAKPDTPTRLTKSKRAAQIRALDAGVQADD